MIESVTGNLLHKREIIMKTIKEQLALVKEILKVEAKELTTDKVNVKNSQRSGNWSKSLGQYGLQQKRQEWRHKFIAYCELRGRTLDEIEGNCREGNEPDRQTIEAYKQQFCGGSDA